MYIIELEIETPDLNETVLFYSEVLGLTMQEVDESKAVFQAGDTRLVFRHRPLSEACYHFAIDIPHNKLIEAFRALRGKVTILPVQGVSFFSHFVEWNAQSFYFFDNTGNLLELICRYDLPNSTSTPFDARSFLRVSEVGLVADDVPAMAKRISDELGLGPFFKQPVMADFAAMGEETGLLVLARQGRKWYPTDKPAKPYYTRLVLSIAGKGNQELVV